MKKLISHCLIVFSFLGFKVCVAEELPISPHLIDMERTLQDAGDLQTFLSRNDLKLRYLTAAEEYFGNEFDRQSYWAILNQLEDAIKKVPGLEERLWETDNLGVSFEIKANRTRGVSIDTDLFKKYIQTSRANLEAQLGRQVNYRKKSVEILNWVSRETDAFEKSSANLSKTQWRKSSDTFFKTITRNTDVQELCIFAYLNYLDSASATLTSDVSDLILDVFSELRQNPSIAFKSIGLERDKIPPGIISAMKKIIPSEADLMAEKIDDRSIFSKITRPSRDGSLVPVGRVKDGRLIAVRIPRRLHGIWKGIMTKECIGGLCGDLLTPQRWATVAIDRTWFYHIELDQEYRGFVQAVPIQVGQRTVASLDLMADVLNRRLIKRDEGRLIDTTVMSEVIKQIDRVAPKEWNGFVLGKSIWGNHTQSHSYARAQPFYKKGSSLLFRRMQVNDPIAKTIALNYHGQYGSVLHPMIFDATASGHGALRLLNLEHPEKTLDLKNQQLSKLIAETTSSIYQTDHISVVDRMNGGDLFFQLIANGLGSTLGGLGSIILLSPTHDLQLGPTGAEAIPMTATLLYAFGFGMYVSIEPVFKFVHSDMLKHRLEKLSQKDQTSWVRLQTKMIKKIEGDFSPYGYAPFMIAGFSTAQLFCISAVARLAL